VQQGDYLGHGKRFTSRAINSLERLFYVEQAFQPAHCDSMTNILPIARGFCRHVGVFRRCIHTTCADQCNQWYVEMFCRSLKAGSGRNPSQASGFFDGSGTCENAGTVGQEVCDLLSSCDYNYLACPRLVPNLSHVGQGLSEQNGLSDVL